MNSDLTTTYEFRAVFMRWSLRQETVFRLRIAAFALFSVLVLMDSLYLIVCYVTVDLYGWLSNPFFRWVRQCGWSAWALYFPAFAGALISADAGARGRRTQRLVAILVLAQFAAGILLYFSSGRKTEFGYTLLYGPDVRMPAGNILTYIAAVACLTPLLWISVIQIASSWKVAGETSESGRLRLATFLLTGATVALLYAVTTRTQLSATGQPIPIRGLLISLAAHLATYAIIFLALAWTTVIANRFTNPGLARFALRAALAWLLLAIVVRKVLFPLFGFNNHQADLHAALFSCAAVLAGSALLLTIRQYATQTGKIAGARPRGAASFAGRACVLAGGLIFFYIFAVRFARIDWERAIASLAAMGTSLFLLAFYRGAWKRTKAYSVASLAVITLVTAAGTAALGFSMTGKTDGPWPRDAQQYADYDASYFVIRQAFQPVVHDESYSGFYDFLLRNSNLRGTMTAPEVTLTASPLEPSHDPPNIFILVIDGLRRDYVSPFNPRVSFTPNIGQFARESAVFENAYTPYAGTALAEAAIWSGYQQVQKVYPLLHPPVTNLQRMLEVDGFDSYIAYDDILSDLVPPSNRTTALTSHLRYWKENEFRAVVRELTDDLVKRTDGQKPVFVYAQPEDVHSLSLTLHSRQVAARPHPGFNDQYASAVEDVDQIFGGLVRFLKSQRLYENSIIILTADHGESLGEAGRQGHVASVTPEVIRIPLVIHLPDSMKKSMVWDPRAPATLHDLAPTLYYLLGHRPVKTSALSGHPLFTFTPEEQAAVPDHFLLMSSYMAVFGSLSGDQKSLFMVDANLRRNYYFDLRDDPGAFRNRITPAIRDQNEAVIRKDLETLDRFYNLPSR